MTLDTSFVEVVFLARLPALSASKFKVFICSDETTDAGKPQQPKHQKAKTGYMKEMTQIYCMSCPEKKQGNADTVCIYKYGLLGSLGQYLINYIYIYILDC